MRTFKQAERERKQRWLQAKRQREMTDLATRPVHEIHPGMLAVLDAVQRQRPSYAAWAAQLPLSRGTTMILQPLTLEAANNHPLVRCPECGSVLVNQRCPRCDA